MVWMQKSSKIKVKVLIVSQGIAWIQLKICFHVDSVVIIQWCRMKWKPHSVTYAEKGFKIEKTFLVARITLLVYQVFAEQNYHPSFK